MERNDVLTLETGLTCADSLAGCGWRAALLLFPPRPIATLHSTRSYFLDKAGVGPAGELPTHPK